MFSKKDYFRASKEPIEVTPTQPIEAITGIQERTFKKHVNLDDTPIDEPWDDDSTLREPRPYYTKRGYLDNNYLLNTDKIWIGDALKTSLKQGTYIRTYFHLLSGADYFVRKCRY